MADIPLKDRRIQFDAPNASNGGSAAFRASEIPQVKSVAPLAHKAGQDVMSTIEVFKKIKRQNDIARATNDLAVYKQKVSDLMNSTEIDPETGEIKGFLHKKGENAFNSLAQYQDKLSALTKEYQQQIYKYDPDIRDKFTLDSDETQLKEMNNINSYALQQTEEFQQKSYDAYIDNVKTKYDVNNSADVDLLRAEVKGQIALRYQGQSDSFYNNQTEKVIETVLERNMRRIEEQRSNMGSYISYDRSLNFARRLYKDGKISEDTLQKLLNKSQLRRFEAMSYENLTTFDDFKNKLMAADGLDNLEKQKLLYEYAEKINRANKAGANNIDDIWFQRLIASPIANGELSGVPVDEQQLSGIAQQINVLLPYVSLDKNTGVSYLNENAMPDELKQAIKENGELYNIYTFFTTQLHGMEKNGIFPLPPIDVDAMEKLKDRVYKTSTRKDADYLKRYQDWQSSYNLLQQYLNDNKNGFTHSPQDVMNAAYDLNRNALLYMPDKLADSSNLLAQANDALGELSYKYAQGKRRWTDYPAMWGKKLLRWFSEPGIIDNANESVRQINAKTADYFANGHYNGYSSRLLGGRKSADAPFYEKAFRVVDDMANGHPVRILYSVKDKNGRPRVISAESEMFSLTPTQVNKAIANARQEFIKIKTERTGKDWKSGYYNLSSSDFSEDDILLQESLVSKELLKFAPGLLEGKSQLGPTKLLIDSLIPDDEKKEISDTKKISRISNKDVLYIQTENTMDVFGYGGKLSELESFNLASRLGYPSVSYNGKVSKTTIELGINDVFEEKNIPQRFKELDKNTFGKGYLYNPENNTDLIRVIVKDKNNKQSAVWVRVPENMTASKFDSYINSFPEGAKIYAPNLPSFNGKTIVKADYKYKELLLQENINLTTKVIIPSAVKDIKETLSGKRNKAAKQNIKNIFKGKPLD